jgi:hypothetical protein
MASIIQGFEGLNGPKDGTIPSKEPNPVSKAVKSQKPKNKSRRQDGNGTPGRTSGVKRPRKNLVSAEANKGPKRKTSVLAGPFIPEEMPRCRPRQFFHLDLIG